MDKLTHLLGAFVVLSLVFAAVERLFPARREQKTFRRGYKTDLAYWLFTPFISKGVTTASIALVLALVFRVKPKNLQAFFDHRETWVTAHLPAGAQMFLLLLIGDVIGYWTHRWFHGRRLWKFHAVHHCSEDLDWLSSVRLHPVNEVVAKIFPALILLALGFNPKVVTAYVPFLLFYAILLHANVSWGFGWLGYVIASPRFHRWHHTSQKEGLDKNFAGLFPWIDRLFGTYYMPEDRLPEKFGLYGEKIPDSIWGQLAYPFRKKKAA